MPTNTVTYAVAIPQTGVAVKWFNAASATGIGTFNITPTLRLVLPAKSYAGTYSATQTYSVVTGP